MKYVFTFNETNYGRIEIEADSRPDNDDIIEKIIEGRADYHNTDFTNFRLVESDGIIHDSSQEAAEQTHEAGVCPKCGSEQLDFDGFFVEDGNGIYKWKCESCGIRGRECYDMTFSEHIIDGEG